MVNLNEQEHANRLYWDELVDVHQNAEAFSDYRVQKFLKGECILDPLVRAEIGDVAGLSILHTQCHFGLDTLSLARLGATVTGLDFSPNGIATARRLSSESGVPATFVEGRVEDARELVSGQFDMIFTTWGAIGWLADLEPWAANIGRFLKPGGVFYMLEGHPLALSLQDSEPGDHSIPPIIYDYFNRAEPFVMDTSSDYADPNAKLKNTRTYEWAHGMGEIVTLLCKNNMVIEFLHEHPVLTWKAFDVMEQVDEYFYRAPDHWPTIPLSFSIRAQKAG